MINRAFGRRTTVDQGQQKECDMFNVKLNVVVAIQGCPENGLAAVDFRKEHGLKPEPTKFVNVAYEANDEAFCRTFPYLNRDADFVFESGIDRHGNLA